jgi:hypothetical protein
MPQYRFYNLEKDQAVIARIDLSLGDDASAIACARQLIVGEEIQVWQGLRLVASLSASADRASHQLPSALNRRSINTACLTASRAKVVSSSA